MAQAKVLFIWLCVHWLPGPTSSSLIQSHLTTAVRQTCWGDHYHYLFQIIGEKEVSSRTVCNSCFQVIYFDKTWTSSEYIVLFLSLWLKPSHHQTHSNVIPLFSTIHVSQLYFLLALDNHSKIQMTSFPLVFLMLSSCLLSFSNALVALPRCSGSLLRIFLKW